MVTLTTGEDDYQRTPRGVDGIEPGYNPATSTAARLREVGGCFKDATTTTNQLPTVPVPATVNVNPAPAHKVTSPAANAATAAPPPAPVPPVTEPKTAGREPTSLAPPPHPPPPRHIDDAAATTTVEEQNIVHFAALLAKVTRRDGSFLQDIRGVDGEDLLRLRDILEKLREAGEVARAAVESEMSSRASADTARASAEAGHVPSRPLSLVSFIHIPSFLRSFVTVCS